MTNEPTYPADAVPGRITPPAAPASVTPVVDDTPPVAPVSGDASVSGDSVEEAAKGLSWQKVGVGAAIGIGSAAIAAALLYTNRSRKS